MLLVETNQVLLPVIRPLTVDSLGIMTRAACKVRRAVVVRAGQRTVADAIAIHVLEARPGAEALNILRRQHLAAVEWFLWISERLTHPQIHTEVQVAQHKDRRLQTLSQVEGLHAEFKTFRD